MKPFAKMVQKLDTLVEKQAFKMDQRKAEIGVLLDKNAESSMEILRASNVSTKIKNLLDD